MCCSGSEGGHVCLSVIEPMAHQKRRRPAVLYVGRLGIVRAGSFQQERIKLCLEGSTMICLHVSLVYTSRHTTKKPVGIIHGSLELLDFIFHDFTILGTYLCLYQLEKRLNYIIDIKSEHKS
jgi:hypothetical protein